MTTLTNKTRRAIMAVMMAVMAMILTMVMKTLVVMKL